MPLSQCNKTYLKFGRDGIRKSQYCAYDDYFPYVEVNCRISSGGSLQRHRPNSLLSNVIGIFSFGYSHNCSDGYPEVLTRVAHYLPWIESIVWPFDRSMFE